MAESTKIHLIDLIPRQIINHHVLEEMQVKNGKIQVNIEKDILKLAVV